MINNNHFTKRWPLVLEPFFNIIHCADCNNHNCGGEEGRYHVYAVELKKKIEELNP